MNKRLLSFILFGVCSLMTLEAASLVKSEAVKSLLPCDVMEKFQLAGWDKRVGKGLGVWVSIARQRVYLINNYHISALYLCSTAAAGIGNKVGSYKTPLGWHVIAECIGGGLPKGAVLKERQFSGRVWDLSKESKGEDLILTRILWLQGIEPGINQGDGIDTHDRYIYIHGTPEESKLGTPVSHGCIRLSNADVIELFNQIKTGTPLLITRW